ncbi:DNA-binding transcriptional ArsR family regulator [Streptacidiphilus sp. MAP12-33]|uniref:ArsR/SmtB family transcription factor n=1 Tax=Streptacidiphilus sp. MAP12-33 TaxID=3156266 RepID=UPI0035114230
MGEPAFSAQDLLQMRFAISPMWEVGTSFRVLRGGPGYPLHRRWIDQVWPHAVAAGLDRGWLAELIPPRSGYVPDFLNPAPTRPAPTLAEELAVVVATPAARVRNELDVFESKGERLGPRLRALHANPAARLPSIAAEIEAYWDLALAPYWARVRAVLEADIHHRARQVAEHGAVRALDELHPSLRWDRGELRLALRPLGVDRETAGTGLLLIPSAFKGPRLAVRFTPPDPPQLAYAARGLGTLLQPPPVAGTDALAAVLGRSRALLLTELHSPASTTDLAARTGLSPGGVSQHLTALRQAGLVSAHRAGRSVLYARTDAAETLLGAAAAGSRPDPT